MRIIVLEAGPLTPESDAGARAVTDLIAGLGELGHEVHVLIESAGDTAQRAAALAPELAIISRPGLFARLQPHLRSLGVPLIYWAHDLHFVRFGLQSRHDTGMSIQASHAMRLVERRCFMSADLAVLPTAAEADRVRHEFPGSRVVATPYFAMPEQPLRQRPPDGARIVFVGGEHHAPNRDGVDWFLNEVWPDTHGRNPATELIVAGRWDRARPWPAGVRYTGVIPDDALDTLLRSARVGIAPLRFGAGIKRKTLQYLSHGLPVVGTEIAVEGLDRDTTGQVPGVLHAASAEQWIAAVASLGDGDRWVGLANSGHRYVREAFSARRFRDGLAAIVDQAHPSPD